MPDHKRKIKKQVKIKREATSQSAPVIYARVTRLATDHVDSAEMQNAASHVHSSGTLERMKKVLDVAKHERTSEHEAKQALQLSAKVFSSTKVQNAQGSTCKDAKMQLQKGGHSTVTVRRRDGENILVREWTGNILSAIEKAFNVKYYHQSWQYYIEFVFYGLRDNTVAAAMSFEAVFNLCISLAVRYKNKNCYLLGLSSSIKEMAIQELKQEELQAVENEKRLLKETIIRDMNRKMKRSRCKTKATTVSDDDDITFVRMERARTNTNSITNVKTEVKVEDDQIPTKHNNRNLAEELPEVAWQSLAQLIAFREMAERVAVEYLKEIKINLTAGPAAERASILHHSSYQLGNKDACNVDLKRRRLEGV